MIRFRGVGRTYRPLLGRRVRAVDDLTLDIERGEVFGLAGPNGAGKSTLIAMLLGYLAPTDGTLTIDGLAPRAFVERRGIGYLSELVNMPPRWPLEQALHRYALLAGVPQAEIGARVDAAAARLGLDEHRGKRVKQLSKGNLQRLGLAQALLHEESVLILDEPTHGLDPVWTQKFRDLVTDLRRPDRVIFIASHNLDELQRLADRVAIMDRGRLQRVVDPRAESAQALVSYRLALSTGEEHVAACIAGAVPLGRGEFLLPPMALRDVNDGVARLLARGALLRGLAPAHSALEAHFREAVGAPPARDVEGTA